MVRIDRYTASETELEFTLGSPDGVISDSIVNNFLTELRGYCPSQAPNCVPKLAAGKEKRASRP